MGTANAMPGAELRDLIARFAPRDGDNHTAIDSLCLFRYSSSVAPHFGVLSPAVCFAAQGHKEVLLGDEVSSYGPGQHFVSSFDLPVSARILGATPARP
jgi:hypothetical protein